MLNDLCNKFQSLKNQINKLEGDLDEVKAAIYTAMIDKISKKGEGTVSEKTDLYKVSVTCKKNITVDQTKAMQIPHLFKTKYEYNKVAFEECSDEERKAINQCIEIKDGKPQFSISNLE